VVTRHSGSCSDQAPPAQLRVVLDGVFNHCGRGFWPFHHVAEAGIHSPYLDWFHSTGQRLDAGRPLVVKPGADQEAEIRRLTNEGMGAGAASRHVLGFEGWWGFAGACPSCASTIPTTRAYLLDGRGALAPVRHRRVAPGRGGRDPRDFWAEFRARCRAVDPDAYLVAEIWTPKPEWLTGRHFDALMDYPLAEAILGYAAGTSWTWACSPSTRCTGGTSSGATDPRSPWSWSGYWGCTTLP